jgi:hypothetical protein
MSNAKRRRGPDDFDGSPRNVKKGENNVELNNRLLFRSQTLSISARHALF